METIRIRPPIDFGDRRVKVHDAVTRASIVNELQRIKKSAGRIVPGAV
jgi:hypothetical protein